MLLSLFTVVTYVCHGVPLDSRQSPILLEETSSFSHYIGIASEQRGQFYKVIEHWLPRPLLPSLGTCKHIGISLNSLRDFFYLSFSWQSPFYSSRSFSTFTDILFIALGQFWNAIFIITQTILRRLMIPKLATRFYCWIMYNVVVSRGGGGGGGGLVLFFFCF